MFLALLTSSPSAPVEPFTGSLLWRISGNGVDSPSYIMGTHHLASAEFLDNMEGFWKALDESKQLYGEIELNNIGGLSMPSSQSFLMPPEISYRELYSEEEYELVRSVLWEVAGIEFGEMEHYKPAFFSSALARALYAVAFPYLQDDDFEALDIYIQRLAKEAGKETYGLESVEDQIDALFNQVDVESQAKRLLNSIKNIDFNADATNKLTTLYYEGELEQMYRLATDEDENPSVLDEEFMESINVARNERWLKLLPTIFAERSTFVAVGALHLAGKEGLLYRLHQMGYSVEPVK